MFVECPACEEQFSIPPNALHQQHTCPGCRRPFVPDNTVDRLRDQPEESSVGEFSESISRSMEPLSKKFRPEPSSSVSRVEVPSPPKEIESATSLLPEEAFSLEPVFANTSPQSLPDNDQTVASRIHSRRKTTPLIMGLMGITGLVAIFGVLFIAIHQLSGIAAGETGEPKPAQQNSTLIASSSNVRGNTKTSPPTDSATSTKRKQGTKNSIPEIVTEPKPEETPETFSMAEFDEVWRKINSYLVRLEITTSSGTREGTGFIIDSRGWVATSWHAVKDATEIRVILASRSFDSGSAWREAADNSRGLIAKDAARDLAIIATNRDLVLNLTEINFDSSALVVGSQRTICARTPPPGRRLWLTELRIDDRVKFEQLENETKSVLEKDAPRDPFERWLAHSQSPEIEQFRGAPIFNKEGRLVAVNTSLSANTTKTGYALPIKYLEDLKNQAEDNPIPFGSMDEVTGPDAADPEAGVTEVADDSNNTDEIADLKRSYETCKAFTFVGRDAEEVEQVELFVQRMKLASDYSVDSSLTVDQRDELKSQISKIISQTETVLAGFGGESVKRIKDMNHMMLLDLSEEKSKSVALICEVTSGAATSSPFLGKSTVTLRTRGSEQYFFVTLSDEAIVMPPGGVFMLFGHTDPSNKLSDGSITSMKLDLLFGIQIRAYGGQ